MHIDLTWTKVCFEKKNEKLFKWCNKKINYSKFVYDET